MRANIDLYAIGVGEDACVEMLQFFADEGKYYAVEDMESLAEKLDFVTRKSLVRLTTRAVRSPENTEENTEANSLPSESPVREIDITKCLGDSCRVCVESCSLSAIQYHEGMMVIRPELCVSCGACDDQCPVGAIRPMDEDGCDGLL